MKKGLAILLMLIMFVPVIAFADGGTTGKIAGYIKDKASGEPLIGVNVYLVERTELGSPTDENGYYVILNIPPGVYTLKATYLGYKEFIVNEIHVTVDLTTKQDILMEESVVEGESITITAVRPIVEKDITSSRSVATKEEFEQLPGGSVTGVASLRAGFVAGTFRGGREFGGETVYVVDGVSMSNPIGNGRVTGSTGAGNVSLATEIPNLSVEEMEVITGGFNAEYGQAQSAVVNIVSKQGSRTRYSGEVRLNANPHWIFGESDLYKPRVTSYYYGPNPMYSEDNLPAATTANWQTIHYSDIPALEAGQYDALTDIYGSPLEAKNLRTTWQNWSDSRSGQFNFGGPEPITTYLLKGIVPGYVTFSLTGTYSHNETDRNRGTRDFNYGWNSNSNITWKPNNSMTFTFGFMTQQRHNSGSQRGGFGFYSWPNGLSTGDLFGYGTSGQPVYVGDYLSYDANTDNGYVGIPISSFDPHKREALSGTYSSRYMVQLTHQLSPTTYYTANFSIFNTGQWTRSFDPITGEALPYDDGGVMGIDAPRFKRSGFTITNGGSADPNASAVGYDESDIDKFTFKMDLTSQVNDKHQIRTGIQVDYFDLFLVDVGIASGGNDYNDKYHKFPVYGGAYIQDKIELEGMIVNVGLRFDYINPKAKYSQSLETGEGQAVDPEYSDYEWVGNELRLGNAATAKAKFQLSPRIGISHPITDHDVLHFAYGHFFQYPVFDRYYTNYTLDLRGAFKYIGNPNIESEKTISYEIGFEHAFSENLKLDVTGFVRNVSDLVNTREVRDQYGQNFYMYDNSDYASIKGFEFSLYKRFSHNWSGQLNYTLQWAKGKNSSTTQTFSDLYNNFVPRTKENYLNWDRRHTITGTFTYRIPENFGESFAGPLGSSVFGDWYLTLVYQYFSGLPYTSPSRNQNPPINDRRHPGWDRWDARINKFIKTFGNVKLQVYANVNNIFDARDRGGEGNRAAHANTEEYLSTGDYTRGTSSLLINIWQNPRTVTVGAGIKF